MPVNRTCCCLVAFLLLISFFIGFSFMKRETKNPSTLVLVHVFLRHGERNPDKKTICPHSQHCDEKYYPEGYGQLTSAGKRRTYNIGKYLRSRYNDFLGETWNVKYLEATSSYYDRTKMSLQMVLASLYPPTGSEGGSPLYWQPIPYNYKSKDQDKLFLPFFVCPKYYELFHKLYEDPSFQKYMQSYEGTFKILADNTNRTITIFEAFFLYIGCISQEEIGYSLEEWTKAVYPEPLRSVARDTFYFMTNTTELRRVVTGYFLKKLLDDTKHKINGSMVPAERKMFIYCGHEMNIATILITLGVHAKHSDLPPYGAYIIFEVHKINKIYGIKIFYQNYQETNPIPLKIKDCDYFCPYDDLYRLLEVYLPKNDDDCFGKTASN